jgi:lysophospholipase L1-like esterase
LPKSTVVLSFDRPSNLSQIEPLESRSLLSAALAPSHLLSNVPEASKYTLVYDLNVPVLGGNFAKSAVPYSVNRAATTTRNFDRVAYYLELAKADGSTQWVYASFKTLTGDLNKIGVPTAASGAFFQGKLSNLDVFSNVPGIVTGTGMIGGNIEFWPKGYGPANAIKIPGASDTLDDFGDQTFSNLPAMGSMQIHNAAAKQTIFAYNDWGGAHPYQPAEIGIGNAPTGNPDWTGANNAGQWTVRRMQVLVHPAAAARAIPALPPVVSPPPAVSPPVASQPTVPPPPVSLPAPTHSLGKVLALGDSLTWGFSSQETVPGGYRLRLWGDLLKAGQSFTYVGSVKDTTSSALRIAGETQHEGHGGFRTDQILGNLTGVAIGTPVSSNNGGHWLDGTATHPPVDPDIVLLMAGTNDMLQHRTVALTADNLSKIIDTLTTFRPRAKVFVSTILPIADPAINPSVMAYNKLIREQIVPRFLAMGRNVVLVDQYRNFVDSSGAVMTAMFPDTVHPTRAGYEKMGDTWAQAILNAYKVVAAKR